MLKLSYNIVHNLRETLQDNDIGAFLPPIAHAILVKVSK